ncbi:MAG: ABC transporter permease [Chloroflexi bacterium]|nr:ABC transporter permease [Chloroflexota bacterium]MBV9897591.1 ABC transporter permease [Chloroflexota bacterium]
MATTTVVSLPAKPAQRTPEERVSSKGELAIVWERFRRHRFALIGLGALLFMLLIATAAPLAPWSPNEIDRTITDPQYVAHGFAPPSADHWFGTDELNRDMFSRILWAGRISLAVGFLTVGFGATIGILIGALAGFYGGWVDTVLMRITDLFLSFPFLPTLILISAMLHQYKFSADVTLVQVSTIVSVLAVLGWMDTARLVRGQFLSLLNRDFVLAARALGADGRRIILRHLIPNSLAPIIVAASLNVGGFIIAESAISFLGVGVSPPTASWGSMLADFQSYLRYSAVAVLLPGGAIFITVMAINFVGDGLRDALDPWLRNR